jgi:hypothetical protein
MTGAGITVPPSRGPAPFAPWSWLAGGRLIGVGVGSLAGQVVRFRRSAGERHQRALEPAHLSLWTAEAWS